MATKKKISGVLRLVWLLVALIVLAGVALLVYNPFHWGQPTQEEAVKQDPGQALLCDFTKADVTGFEIAKPGEAPFKLERDGEQWFVIQGGKRFRAGKEKIDKMLEELPGLRAQGIATDKVEMQATFEVDQAKGIVLSVFTGKAEPKVKLIVGKTTPSYDSAFVRVGDGKEIYRAGTNVKSLVGFAFADYRTKTPWKFDPANATKLSVRPMTGDAAAQTFEKKDGVWKTASGGNANQNLITELLKKISEISINEYVDTPDDAVAKLGGLTPNVIVTAPDGEYKLTIGATDVSNVYCQDQDNCVYKVPDYQLKTYTELAFDKLSFDDTKQDEAAKTGTAPGGEVQPDEGVKGNKPSDKDEPKGSK